MKSDIIFKYENDIEILWNGSATFNVYDDGNYLACFTDYSAKTKKQAQVIADEWLEEQFFEEEQLRNADSN
tara:strand:+ start:666 stop:878 length:213 start_codon:yes stop_codon:yes gene_type:complete